MQTHELPMSADEILIRLSHLARTATSASLQLRALGMLMRALGMLTPAKPSRTSPATIAPKPDPTPASPRMPAPTAPVVQAPAATAKPPTQRPSAPPSPPPAARQERGPAIPSASLIALAGCSGEPQTAAACAGTPWTGSAAYHCGPGGRQADADLDDLLHAAARPAPDHAVPGLTRPRR